MGMAGDGRDSGKPASRRKVPGTTGRVAPKGAPAGRDRIPEASGRYTPPVSREQKVSRRWVPVLMFALLATGVVLIIVNYLGALPGGSDNRYLLLGLALITGGFITATQYR